MKSAILGLLILLVGNLAKGQDKPAAYEVYEGYNLWNKQIGDTSYVFADMAYVRDYPSTQSVILDSLIHGTLVVIKSNGYNSSHIRGFHAPWHEIAYIKDGKARQGFIWLGLLALGRHVDALGNQFIHGFLKREKESEYDGSSYLCEVKYLTPNQHIIARYTYSVDLSDQTYAESKLLPNMGLEGLQTIHRVGFHGEACGIPTTHYYVGWNGQHFVTMFNKSSVSDAGVFYHEEIILFPSEHNLDSNLIIKDIIEGEAIDEQAQELKFKETRSREKFLWDGKVVTQLLEMR